MPHPVFAPRALLQRAALQDRVATRAAAVARQAEQNGDSAAAEIFWRIAHRSRVQALQLRAQAEARQIGGE